MEQELGGYDEEIPDGWEGKSWPKGWRQKLAWHVSRIMSKWKRDGDKSEVVRNEIGYVK